MKKLLFFALMFFGLIVRAQQPGKQETFDYIRGKLIALATHDDVNGITEVKFDGNSTMTLAYEDGSSGDIFWSNLDANAIGWDIYDPNKNSNTSFDKLIRITIASKTGFPGRQNYKNGQITNFPANKAIIWFSLPRAADIPNFQDKLTKAIKRFIELCGGKVERDIF